MSELLKINVNGHTEKKGQLTYLSWAWAWAEVLKIDPLASWNPRIFNDKPCMYLADGSAMVSVDVTIKSDTKGCVLPVMDHKNKAINNPDAFAVNTAIMRCLAKAIGIHGLGLYIYAGEDLPEPDAPKPVEERAADWLLAVAEAVDVDALRDVLKNAKENFEKAGDAEAYRFVKSAASKRNQQLTKETV